jgi:regulator of protease activity HflC (stomatin/prohibitin superfamily)
MADFAVPGNTLRLNVISLGVFLLSIALAVFAGVRTQGAAAPIIIMLVGIVVMQSPKIAQQWERGVVLRLGRFVGLRGPGLFWIVPFVDSVSSWIDQRTITTGFAAEQTLTSDTVPVNVDAVLF